MQSAACITYWPLHAATTDKAEATSRRWALLADTHLAANRDEVYRGSYPYKNLTSIVPSIKETAPSGALIVGDVARHDGRVADYELLKSVTKPLASEVPIFLGLGNHDHRPRFRQVFPQSPDSGVRQALTEKHVVVIDQAPIVRIVLLDSLRRVNEGAGELGAAQRTWLQGFLSKPKDDVPVVIAVHHTFGSGGGHLQDTTQFFQMIDDAPQVKAVLYGHSHRFQFSRRKGLHLINLPPVGYAFDHAQPLGWLDTEFHASGAKLTLKTVDPKSPRSSETKELDWR